MTVHKCNGFHLVITYFISTFTATLYTLHFNVKFYVYFNYAIPLKQQILKK